MAAVTTAVHRYWFGWVVILWSVLGTDAFRGSRAFPASGRKAGTRIVVGSTQPTNPGGSAAGTRASGDEPVGNGAAESSSIDTPALEGDDDSRLKCRVQGFYPFPTPLPKGPLGWMLKDTHQAVLVTSVPPPKRAQTPCDSGADPGRTNSRPETTTTLRMDFMTKGGAAHPVWYDDATRWKVFFGGTIEGEVRIRVLGTGIHRGGDRNLPSERMERLVRFAESYDTGMNLYSNNCRVFAARAEREAERLNHPGGGTHGALAADARCCVRIL